MVPMTEGDSKDTLHRALDDLVAALPPPPELPPGFAGRARHRRELRLAGLLGSLAVLAAGAAVALTHNLSPGQATLQVTAPPPASSLGALSGTSPPARHSSTSRTLPPATSPTGPAMCSVAELIVSLGPPNGAAGSVYYPLRFHNRSALSCTLDGYPGVSFVSGPAGGQIGAPATRDQQSPARTLLIAPGGTVAAAVQVVDPYNYPTSGCQPVHAAGLRVYPPGSTAAVFLPLPGPACSVPVSAGSDLSVSPVVNNTTGQP